MYLVKTPQAVAALSAKDRSLTPRERQMLILCDGSRQAVAVMGMVGVDGAELAQGLVERGFLAMRAKASDGSDIKPAALMAEPTPRRGESDWMPLSTGGFRPSQLDARPSFRDTQSTSSFGSRSMGFGSLAPTDAAPTSGGPRAGDSADPYATRAPSSVRTKRSLAGSKMYLMDLLQMQRHPDASALAVSIHTSDDEAELVRAMMDAWRFIYARSGPNYAEQVADKLAQTLPERFLPDLEHARWDMT